MPLGARPIPRTPVIPAPPVPLPGPFPRNLPMLRPIPASLLALLLALPASAQEAKEWVQYHKERAEVRAFKVLQREEGGVQEVLARIACLPDLKETEGCATALEVYRKLSSLLMRSRVTFRAEAAPGKEGPGGASVRLTRYAVDCARKRYAPLSIEWRGVGGETITRIEYPQREWRGLDRIEVLGRQVCG